MPTRAPRRCPFPGCRTPAGQCDKHTSMANRGYHRTTPTKVARALPGVQAHRAAAVAAHVRRHGWICLGDQHHPRHKSHDLVADDPTPIARGGNPMQPLNVMCRSANSRKGARPRDDSPPF